MKIIKKGVAPNSKPIRFECTKCQTVFEAERGVEARYIPDYRDGDFWHCVCPTCRAECTKAAR